MEISALVTRENFSASFSKINSRNLTGNREGVPPPKKIVFKGLPRAGVMAISWSNTSTYSAIAGLVSISVRLPKTEIGKSQ